MQFKGAPYTPHKTALSQNKPDCLVRHHHYPYISHFGKTLWKCVHGRHKGNGKCSASKRHRPPRHRHMHSCVALNGDFYAIASLWTAQQDENAGAAARGLVRRTVGHRGGCVSWARHKCSIEKGVEMCVCVRERTLAPQHFPQQNRRKRYNSPNLSPIWALIY